MRRADQAATIAAGLADGAAINAGDGDLQRVSAAAWAALLAANAPPVIYSFGGAPSWIEHDDQGAPFVRLLTLDRVRYRLARVSEWYRLNKYKQRVAARPPKDVCADLLARPDPPLPRLVRIAEAPVFTASGRLLATEGYDAESGILYAPPAGFTLPPVPEAPSPSEITLGLRVLDNLLGDFPFIGPAEQTHAVALFLLPYVREIIHGPTPLHLIEKPMPGTGATLLVEALTVPATGRAMPAMGAPRDDSEMGKRITALLRRGAPAVFIDNIPEKWHFDSAELARAITASCWGDRILGLSEDVRLPVRALFIASGNNPVLSAELARRTVRCRLDARMEHPADRTAFRHADLRGWVRQNRAEVVWAGLTLIQAWMAAGRPEESTTLGGFENWSKVMGGILGIAGLPGFLTNMANFRDTADAEGVAIRGFLTAWWEKHESRRLPVATLYTLAKESDLDIEGKTDRGSRTRLGKLLGALKDRRYRLGDGVTVAVQYDGLVEGITHWKLVRG
jgi:putative DNA primase/helicase